MPHTLALFTGPWADLPLSTIAAKASEWGYQALDIACWGEHLAVQRALAEADYCRSILDTLEKHELSIVALSNHPVGQAVSDRLDSRHQATLPEWVWGDGRPEEVSVRAAQEIIDTAKVAQQLGVSLIIGRTGSPFSAAHFQSPPVNASYLEQNWQQFAQTWKPVLDELAKMNCRFACEIGAAQTVFDLDSAEATLAAVQDHSSFGFSFAPAGLHWQGVDPTEFLRAQSERIWHVLVQDAAVTLNGRNGLLGGLLKPGHAKRGWNYRAPGYGHIDWPGLLRVLHQLGYSDPLTVSFEDNDMDRDYGAAEAVNFIRRLDFQAVDREGGLFG